MQKLSAVQSFRTMETAFPVTQLQIPEGLTFHNESCLEPRSVWHQLSLHIIQKLWLEGIFHDATGVGIQGVSIDDQHTQCDP